ncbi:hypothetical protein JTE90_024887 [Oedothorax gibbosus]|uniref:WH2 domain-containing protein n=1 Tax=Oedothorax gibbosus TaxID=931172 RepID=A0AAV6V3C8_9ARAC|nr:hypothetical protein JTE90_024887 [Oedothorax gibbosus]
MPPPPPPPPAPPLLKKIPISGLGAPGKANHTDPPADRNALLSQIRKGARLKKAETNDKSAPLIDGAKRSTPVSAGRRPSDTNKSNGPFPVIPPGGLFAQGIPKLRPTTPRSGDSSGPSSLTIQSIKGGIHNTTSSLDHLRIGQLSGSRSQPPSPVSKPRMSPTNRTDTTENSGNPNFPDDLNIKGPAPVPPPASQKPNFNRAPDNERPAATVKRSASQTNLGQRPRVNRPPPNVKPPPPPKSNNVVAPPTAPPPPPSKPPNIMRRQSFGVGEASRFAPVNKMANGTPKPISGGGAKNAGLAPPPPPPPRNNSVPNELNQIGSSSPNQWSKMNIAPPPPPNRAGGGTNRAAPIRPAPPRAPAPPPPPPPQHSSHPAPPSQMKAMLSATNSSAPPPPTRVSSMKQSSDFEERFKFHPAQTLPKPDRFPNTQKSYPSKVNRQKQNTRRLPPPPPPQTGNSGQSVLHIQLNSGIFSNNFAHS